MNCVKKICIATPAAAAWTDVSGQVGFITLVPDSKFTICCVCKTRKIIFQPFDCFSFLATTAKAKHVLLSVELPQSWMFHMIRWHFAYQLQKEVTRGLRAGHL
ncbi:hypothetical protein GOODEAATRI_029517 [Goodea atripinnis]|uniref:Uncharacterized protein n=1 Tax=Goodea atripinnis TaxID=208336 RepID=A0ABV0N574_9TELE